MPEPTVPADIEVWTDAIAKIAGNIPGIQAVFSGGRGEIASDPGNPRIQPMIDEELLVTPAAVLYAGDWEVTAGSWEHQKHELELLIWCDQEPIATSYAEAIAWPERVMSVFPARAKAFEVSPILQSVLVTGGGGIESRVWPEGSDRHFLVRSVSLEVELRRGAQYQPR